MRHLKNLKSWFALFLLFGGLSINAQPALQMENTDELETQKQVVYEDYPGVFKKEEIKEVEKIDPKHSKIFYSRGQVNFETVVNSNKKDLLLVVNFEEIDMNRLPTIVKDNFKRSQDGNKEVKKVFIGTMPSSGDFYRIDVYDKKYHYKSFFYDDIAGLCNHPINLFLFNSIKILL